MEQDKSEVQKDQDVTRSEEDEAGRQVARVTGMSADAAATYAAFISGRFAQRPAFPDAA